MLTYKDLSLSSQRNRLGDFILPMCNPKDNLYLLDIPAVFNFTLQFR